MFLTVRARAPVEQGDHHLPQAKALLYLVTGLGYLILIGWAIITLLPMYWLFTGAFKAAGALESMPPEWFPTHVSLESFQKLFQWTPFFRWMFNTAFVSVVNTLGTLMLSAMAAYAIAKKRFPGRRQLFSLMMGTMMIPPQVTLIPLYILVTMKLGWADTYSGLIIPALFSVWTTFLLKQFMQTLPTHLIEAARIDACSEFAIFFKIVLPLSKPALTVAGILNFVGHWNSFFWPLLVTTRTDMRLLQVGLAGFRFEHTIDYGPMMAGAALSALPIIVVFFLLQRFFLQGLTVGALKS